MDLLWPNSSSNALPTDILQWLFPKIKLVLLLGFYDAITLLYMVDLPQWKLSFSHGLCIVELDK